MALNDRIRILIEAVDRATKPTKRAFAQVNRAIQVANRVAAANRIPESVDRTTRAVNQLGHASGQVARRGLLAGGLAAFAFKRGLLDTASQFEDMNAQLTALTGSSEGAERAMAWVFEFAKKTPLQVGGVVDAFAQLKAFGLDPMDGTMRKLVDQSEKLGGGQQRLEGIILAVGKAWSRGKLQAEEAQMLLERGVPVWELLAKATGHTTEALQEASSEGRLTRKAIRLLIDEMGADSLGAAERRMRSWSGLVSNMRDWWTRFSLKVMGNGLFDFMRTKLAGVIAQLEKLEQNGRLDEIARMWGDKLQVAFEGGWRTAVKLAKAVQWLANFLGGYDRLLMGIAAIAAGPLILAFMNLGLVLGLLAFKLTAVAWTSGLITTVAVPAFLGLLKAVKAVALFFIANPIGLGITALAVSAFLVIKHWDKVRTFWARLRLSATDLIEWFATKAPAALQAVPDLIIAAWQKVKGYWDGVVESLSRALDPLMEKVSGLLSLAEKVVAPVRAVVGAAAEGVAEFTRPVRSLFTGDGGSHGRNGARRQHPTLPPVAPRRHDQMSGQLGIRIDAPRGMRPRVTELRGENLELDVASGLVMAGG